MSEAPDEVRLAFFLSLLADAPDSRLRTGDINKRLKTKAAQALGFTKDVPAEIRDSELVRTEKAGRSTLYQLTEAGAARLSELRNLLPPVAAAGRGRIIPPTNDAVRRGRTAHLLIQLLEAKDRTLPAPEANKTSARARALELNAATARAVRGELAAQGYLTISRDGRTERYTLTDAGLLHLGTLEFYDAFVFKLTGRALNALLDAAREAAKQFAPPDEVPSEPIIDGAVLAAFGELLRERHAVTGLVPIPEVRAAVRQRLGPAAARHDVFDEAVLRLWRANRVRLTPIADRGKVTPDQLQDAIPGVGETLYFLEVAREPAAV